jgi:hypothetical protein
MLKYMDINSYINNNFNDKDSKEILAITESRLENLKNTCVDKSKNHKKYLYNTIYPSIAIYEALKDKMDSNQALEHMDKMIFDNTSNTTKKIYMRMGKLPFFFGLLRKMLSTGLKGDSWEVEWISNNKKRFEFNIKRCLWHDTFREYDCPELCRLFCRNDEINFNNASKRVKFTRENTLGYGDSHCDFHFTKQKIHN